MNREIIISILGKEFTEWVRTRRLLVVIALLIFVAISSPLIAQVMPQLIATLSTNGITISVPDPTWKDALDQYMKNYSQFVLIVIMVIGVTLFSEEKSKKTLELLLARPVSRKTIVLSKFCIAMLISAVGSFVSILIFRGYTTQLFEPISLGGSFWLWILLVLQMGVIVSMSLLASLLFSSAFTAFGVIFAVYVVVTSLLGMLERFQSYLPSYVLHHYTELFTKTASFGDFLPSTLVSVGLIMSALFATIVVFKNEG